MRRILHSLIISLLSILLLNAIIELRADQMIWAGIGAFIWSYLILVPSLLKLYDEINN